MQKIGTLPVALSLLAVGTLSYAQIVPPPPPPPSATGGMQVTAGFPGTAYLGFPAKGKPYSAQLAIEHTQTLADGTHVVQKPITTLLFRDSEGRTRTERPFMRGPNAPPDGPMIVVISDPVEGYQYTLDTVNHVAHRVTVTPPPNRNGRDGVIRQGGRFSGVVPANSQAIAAIQSSPSPQLSSAPSVAPTVQSPRQNANTSTTENLGTQSIEGVLAEGRGTTTVIPTGAQGNDAPITTMMETWFSPQIGRSVLTKISDPRNGENITRLTNIVLGDPDPALFQPPPDYQIVDETGPFQIRFAAPAQQ